VKQLKTIVLLAISAREFSAGLIGSIPYYVLIFQVISLNNNTIVHISPKWE
jgi:hypothetical protein